MRKKSRGLNRKKTEIGEWSEDKKIKQTWGPRGRKGMKNKKNNDKSRGGN